MADDPHADATPIELISQNEALQRERSGGFLANGQRAPEIAAVYMQSPPPGGGNAPAPKQPSAQSQPAAPQQSDDAYWSQFEKPAAGAKQPKGKKVSADPEADYWDQYGQPEAPPAAPAAAPKQKGSLWRSAVDAIGQKTFGAAQGLGESTMASGGALNTIAAPLVQSVEAWKDLLTGKVKSLDQNAPTDWQDAWFKHTVDPVAEHAQDFALDQSATFGDKAAHAIGGVLGYLSQAILTGGAGEEVTATTTGMDLAAHGIKAAQAPAISQAVNVGQEAYKSTGDAELSFKLAATTYGFSVVQNAGPIAMPGKLAVRAGSGAAIAGLGGEAEREATNVMSPDEMQRPFSAEDTVLNLAQGGLMGGIAGPRLDAMPHQAIEKPQNIMEHAQVVAAAEAKANGGDMLDQTVAAAHVNSVLSAHHDAAAYEAHMETQHQRVTEENAVADQQAEQQAREDALNQAANEKAPATTPEAGFEAQAKTLQERKDADYTKAQNQKGDQEIERGDTLAAGAEKGGEGFEKPTLLSTLSPEQAEAFKTLKERRAAEGPQEDTKSVTERLKEQNPEDNFTPYVESKVAEAEEKPAEGDSWKAPTGAQVEVLKDHGDGTYTIRTTPEDSSQVPRRRKVSEASLNLMKSTAEPVEAPQTLGERRAGAASEAAIPEPAAEPAVTAEAVDAAAKESAYSPDSEKPTPTPAQYEAGNYQKGHVDIQGMPVTIEHPAGSERPLGNGETRTMESHYGYVKGTVAADGQHVDMLVGKHPENDTHFIVDHMNDQGYEQAKVLTGFANRLEALRAYRKAYPDNPMGPVTEMKTPALKDWLKNGDTTKPVDPKGVNRMADSRFADTKAPRFKPEDVTHHVDGDEHTFSSPGGITMANRTPEGNLRVISSDTQNGMRGRGEGGARLEHAAQYIHKEGGKLESANQVSDQEQRRYKALAEQGYDVKTNPHRTDPGTGEKFSTSELKPVYEVGPKNEPMRARDEPIKGEAPHSRDASDADRRVRPRMTQEEATAALKPLTDKIGSDKIQVHTNKATLPDNIQEQMVKYNHRNPRGVYDPTTGIVHIVADAHRSNDELMRTAVHEIAAHKGLHELFGDDIDRVLQDIHDNVHSRASVMGSPLKGVNKVSAKGWMKDYMSQHGLDPRNPRHQQLAAEEYVAHLAEHDVNDPRQENPSILRKVYDTLRAGLRKLGLVREWTDNDLRALLRKAKTNLESENAGIRESAQLKGDGPRFADEEDHGAESLAPGHPLSQAHKYGMTKEAQANYNPGFVRSRLDALENAASSKDAVLAAISLHNIPDFGDSKAMPSPRTFSRMVQRLDGRRGQLAEESAKIARDWETWGAKPDNMLKDKVLRETMGSSTLTGVDPSKPFESRYTEDAMRLDATKRAHDNLQRGMHERLKRDFNSLDNKGREIYGTVRDAYTKQRDTAQQALETRIKATGADDKSKASLLDLLRKQFESGRVQGPYFPLARFGDRWGFASHADGSPFSYSRFESKAEQRAWLNQRKAEGFTGDQLRGGQRAETAASIEKIDPKFVAKVTELVKGMDPGVADEIWQEYLKSMPEMSLRKGFIHRQGRLGFSSDQLRAFASQSFHSAHQTARLEYAHQLDGVMDRMNTEREAIEQKDPTSSDSDWANAMYREFGRRYDWIKNPKGSPIAAAITKFGAAWYLGWSPATAFRILSQNPMIALPTLGGRHGYGPATLELGRAMGQWARSKGSLGDTLRGKEREAFDEASDMGVFSNNFTQTLASGGSGNPMYTGSVYHYMRASQFIFNGMEHLNRQSTYLAAYRLATAEGKSHEDAVYHAVDMSRLSHFDYSNANRPRILQSNTAKVVGLFKTYSAGVTYRLAREFREMTTLEHQDPGERAQAAKTFAGLMAGTMMFAGVTGVPFSWLAFYAMDKAFGTKDQPFDSKAAFHAWLTDHMGHRAADAVVTGPMGAMSGASLSTGSSYSDLWYKPPAKDMKPSEQWSDAMGQMLGAVPAIATNAITGAQMMGDDHMERGLEHFVPPVVAGAMKAWRYSHEGVTNLQGEQIISPEELSGWEIALQAAAFTPQKVHDAFEWTTARKNLEKEITDRKSLLLNRFDTAFNNGDSEAMTKASTDLTRFAIANPGIMRDLSKTMTNSVMGKAKKSATSVAGANLNPGLRNLDSTYGSSPFGNEQQ